VKKIDFLAIARQAGGDKVKENLMIENAKLK